MAMKCTKCGVAISPLMGSCEACGEPIPHDDELGSLGDTDLPDLDFAFDIPSSSEPDKSTGHANHASSAPSSPQTDINNLFEDLSMEFTDSSSEESEPLFSNSSPSQDAPFPELKQTRDLAEQKHHTDIPDHAPKNLSDLGDLDFLGSLPDLPTFDADQQTRRNKEAAPAPAPGKSAPSRSSRATDQAPTDRAWSTLPNLNDVVRSLDHEEMEDEPKKTSDAIDDRGPLAIDLEQSEMLDKLDGEFFHAASGEKPAAKATRQEPTPAPVVVPRNESGMRDLGADTDEPVVSLAAEVSAGRKKIAVISGGIVVGLFLLSTTLLLLSTCHDQAKQISQIRFSDLGAAFSAETASRVVRIDLPQFFGGSPTLEPGHAISNAHQAAQSYSINGYLTAIAILEQARLANPYDLTIHANSASLHALLVLEFGITEPHLKEALKSLQRLKNLDQHDSHPPSLMTAIALGLTAMLATTPAGGHDPSQTVPAKLLLNAYQAYRRGAYEDASVRFAQIPATPDDESIFQLPRLSSITQQVLREPAKGLDHMMKLRAFLAAHPNCETATLDQIELEMNQPEHDRVKTQQQLTGLFAALENAPFLRARAAYLMSRIFERAGKPVEAEKALVEAMQLDPRKGLYTFRLSQLATQAGNSSKSTTLLEQSISRIDTPLAAFLDATQNYRAAKNGAKAAATLQQALDRSLSFTPEAYGLLGQLLAEAGKSDEAIAQWQKGCAMRGSEPLSCTSLISALIAKDQWDQAQEIVNQGLNRFPKDAEMNHLQGQLLIHGGDAKAALRYFETAYRLRTDNLEIALSLADGYTRTGNRRRATTLLQGALASATDKLQVRIHLADLYERQREWAAALEQLLLIVKERPTDVAWLTRAARVETNLNRFQLATQTLQKALEMNRDYGPIYHAMGILLARQTRYPDAALQLKDAKRLMPKDPEVILDLAIVLEKNGQNSSANEEYAEALTLSPKSTKGRLSYARFSGQQKEQARAYRLYQELIDENPRQISLQLEFADLLLRNREYKRALELLTKSRGLQPKRFQTIFNMAICYEELEEPAKAIPLFQQALKLNPRSIDSYYRLGRLYKDQNQLGLATQYLERFLRLAPDADPRIEEIATELDYLRQRSGR